MGVIDELLARLDRQQGRDPNSEALSDTATPRRRVAIVACMDPRADPCALLSLTDGDAHVLRNAGGVVTDDMIRSLAISQRKLGTEEVMLIHHTDCDLQTFNDDHFRDEIRRDSGIKPSWSAETFGDLDAEVRQSIARVETSPFLLHVDRVRGFVHDLVSGQLREVT
ncbi:MAG TPA: carbonic anhydrase [Conexibacter sp.]|jgi:carbonic anhydrase